MPTPFAASLAGLTLLALASGCALQPRSTFVPLRAVGEISRLRSSGRVALTVLDPGAGFNLAEPENRTGAAGRVARESMIETLRTGGEGALLFPVAFVFGGISGAVFGVSETEATRGAQAVARATGDAQLEAQLASTITTTLRTQGVPLERAADNLPLDEPARTRRWITEGPDKPHLVWSARPRHPLHGRADTLLGVRILFQGFQRAARPSGLVIYPRDEVNPPLALIVSVTITAVGVADWRELGGVSITSTSEPRTFTAWAADDARELRRALAGAANEIHREIEARLVVASIASPSGSEGGSN